MDIKEILIITLHLFLSLILGFAIGYERKVRFKEAGIRTHAIVCLGSCIYMIVSKSFAGSADSARVAAQIVSGIGFIGAGMIFNHKQVVYGLTTAAGIWATAAIGMLVGAELWAISIIASALLIIFQFVLHLPIKLFKTKYVLKLNVVFEVNDGSEKEHIKQLFNITRFTKINAKKENGKIIYSALIKTKQEFTDKDIFNALNDNSYILSITREDEEF